jgi:hypothetical protein
MSEEMYKGWKLRFVEKQDKEGMWLDEMIPETVSGTTTDIQEALEC